MSLLQMSFAGAVMILAITIIRALAISLLPKKTFLALWGIAVARLLLPFSLPSMFSVYSLISNHTSGIAATKVPQIDKVLPIDTIGQMATMPGDIGNTTSTVSIWGAVWAAGTLICAMVFVVAYWKCRQEFQTSLPVKNDFIKNWLNAHQLKRPISIRQSSRFSAPLTYGVFRPVILMPISADWENTKALQYVLAHEYVHIRRFDSITKLVLIAALCVHWFNPLVWVMYVLANRDIELSCDEAVVRLFGETTKAAYARALISMEETRSGLTPLCNNFSKNAIEERITAIMKIKKASIFSLVVALALVVGVTTAFATSAAPETSGATVSIPTTKDAVSFGIIDPNAESISNTDVAEVQAGENVLWGKVSPENSTSTPDNASVSPSVMGIVNEQGTKTSISAQSTIFYSFGSGENETFYEKGTEIEFIIQCAYADIPVNISLVSADNSKVIDSQRVESDEQVTVTLTIPEDGDYLIAVKNESLSRTQEYSHLIAR